MAAQKRNIALFSPPDLDNKILEEEFYNLNTRKKVWIYWNSSNEEKNTVVKIIQTILVLEQNAQISPINEYMRHTFKAFAYFVNKTLDNSKNKNRIGEDIGEIKKSTTIIIDNKEYKLILRDSGQIQLFDDEIKVIARPLLKQYLKETQIEYGDKKTTRWYGLKVFETLNI